MIVTLSNVIVHPINEINTKKRCHNVIVNCDTKIMTLPNDIYT